MNLTKLKSITVFFNFNVMFMSLRKLSFQQALYLINHGKSHHFPINFEGFPIGVNKLQVFLSIAPLLEGKNYWKALMEAYTMSDNLFEFRIDLIKSFLCKEPDKWALMKKSERSFLERLPSEISIYRGMTKSEYESGEFGVSWTLNRKVAEYFAFEYQRNFNANQPKIIHELMVSKHSLHAYFSSRNEKEVVYIHEIPENLKMILSL